MLIYEPSGYGREIVRLGTVTIGEVALNPGGKRVHAWARIYLPDATSRALPATSIEAAKRIIGRKVEEWLEAAGLRAT